MAHDSPGEGTKWLMTPCQVAHTLEWLCLGRCMFFPERPLSLLLYHSTMVILFYMLETPPQLLHATGSVMP